MSNTRLPKLLVVDDEVSVINSVKMVLEYDYEIYSANSAEAALEVLNNNADLPDGRQVHMMLLDIGLPGMTGLELLRQIKPVHSDVEVILMTADTSSESEMTAMKYGAFDYITKPFDIDHLANVVKNASEKVSCLN